MAAGAGNDSSKESDGDSLELGDTRICCMVFQAGSAYGGGTETVGLAATGGTEY